MTEAKRTLTDDRPRVQREEKPGAERRDPLTPIERRPSRLTATLLGTATALGGVANLFRFDSLDTIPPGDFNLLGLTLVAIAAVSSFFWTRPASRAGGLMLAVFVTIAATSWLLPPLTATASMKQSLFLVTVPLLYLAGSRCLTWPQARRAFLFTLAACGLTTAVGLSLWGTVIMGRTSFDGGDPISQGRVAVIGAAIGFVLFLRASGMTRLLGIALAAICTLGALGTGSRGPLLVFGIAGLILIFVGHGRHRFIRSVTALVLITGALMAAVTIPGPVSRALGSGTGQSDAERTAILDGTFDVLSDHPMGVGLGNLWQYLPPGALVANAGERQYPHNVLVEAAAEGGLVAGAFLLALCFTSGLGILRQRHTTMGQMLIAVWIICVGSAMTSSDLTGNRMMWVMLGVGIAARGWLTDEAGFDASPDNSEKPAKSGPSAGASQVIRKLHPHL